MKSKKRGIIIASAVIVILAVVLVFVLPFIKGTAELISARKYYGEDLKNVDNIILLADCCTVDGKTNSVAGVKEAVRLGADAVMVDLCFRTDGTPVITDNYEDNKTAETVEELFHALNEEKFKDVRLYLNIVQLSGLTELNRLAVSYNMAGRTFLCGIDKTHYGLITSDDTIIPFLLEHKISKEEKDAIANGTFSAPESIAKYGASGLDIDVSDATADVVSTLDGFGIPFIVTGVGSADSFCKTLINGASTVFADDIELCSDILEEWVLSMQERHSSSVEQSLEDLKNNK